MISYSTLLFYVIVFFISIGCYHISQINKNASTRTLCKFISIFLLWFISVFRANTVGTDYINVGNAYTGLVENTYNYSYNWFWGPLRLFCKVIGYFFGSNPFWFYFILGSIFIFALFKMLNKVSENKEMSLLLFIAFGLFLQSFNQTRQMVALVLILYSMRYLEKNQGLKYMLTILIASIFHETSLVFLLVYFLKNIKMTGKTIIIYFIVCLLLFLFRDFIIDLISYTKYDIYFTTKYNVSNVKSTFFNLGLRLVLFAFCLLNRKNVKGYLYNFSYHMVMLCTLMQFLVIKYYFVARFTTYFFAFYIILLPKCIDVFLNKFSEKSRIIVKHFIYLVLIAYFLVYYISPSGAIGSGYDVYRFIFNRG